ncbi:MAG: NusG domain II-containing protein [Eubacterium sp.]|nr:NusG domain II-containing protein [Eubacterium sp.]
MKQKTIKIILSLVIVLILAAAAVSVYFIYFTGQGGATVNIYSEGELIKTVNPSTCGDMTFDVVNSSGGRNTVAVSDGMISVTGADCPDKVCVHTAGIKNDPHPIICVPNQLIISVEGAYGP